uniref:Transmembrane protein 131-like N-terminal domain-containing protein n=1 Tax=Arundo donax TaxID=35708 RepID=A0A0A9DX01_ARUDO
MAVSSPYQMLPLTGIDVVVGGHLERNLSIYNPYDDTLYVEEVAVWMSSLESTRQSSHIVCQLGLFDDGALDLTSSSSNWYTASNAEFGWPMVSIRPSEYWEVLPSKSSTVAELKLQALSEGKVFGAICLKLRNCTADLMDTFVIPIELEVHSRTYYDSSGLVAVTFERVSSCCDSRSIFSLSLRNDASKLLRIVGVSEDNRNGPVIFQVKYLSGLVLFPDTVTDIALIRHTSSIPKDFLFNSCSIVVKTNSTLGSSITIPCEDFVRASLSHTTNAVFAESDGPFTGRLYEEEVSANARTRSLRSMLQVEGMNNVKQMIMRASKADDTTLRQWRSHGTRDGISVLMDHELMFPVVQIGSQFSKWITIHNPSLDHAAVQLVLNSEEIIDHCKTVNDACEYAFSSRSPEIDSTETRFGFSLSDAAITETQVGPSETALLGPVVFRPSNGCMWSSMVLIRNNLSGVEMLPLRAHGGRQSIVLLEGSEPVWKLEFNLGSHVQNKSTLSKSEVPSPLCSEQLSKEIHVKNSGDLPLQVTKVKISGADCGVDGFSVDNCKGFNLGPSESIRMLISFQADFSSAMVQRDLELAMSTGIFVIPMSANIPVCMLSQCRKSYIRSIHWKWLMFFFGAVTVLVLIFVKNVPHSVGSEDYYTKIDDRKSSINKTVKPLFLQPSNEKSRSVREHRRPEALPEKYPASVLANSKMTDDNSNRDEQLNTTSTVSMSPANPVEDKASREVPQTSENLTIRISRDKGKRRKRKVGGAGLAAKFEVSSSHSGNSTPSSPLSPSSTPKQGWTFSGAPSELKHESKLESGFDVEATAASAGTRHEKKTWLQAAKEQPRAPSATPGNTLPPATVSTTAWHSPLLATSSPISPHVRAPGSNLTKDKALKRDDGGAPKKEFTYDIWGDHFPGNLLEKAREVAPCKTFDASEGVSYSFFAREPQALMMKPSSSPPVSRGRGSPPSDVASGYGIK